MRCIALILVCVCSSLAAAEITVGRWNGMLVVTAPGGSSLAQLGGRLDQRISLQAQDQPITETAEFLRRATGLNIVLAPTLIAQPPLVSLQVREMALGDLFTWIRRVAGVHIGYVNEAVFISDQPVQGASETRLYDVSDLALPIQDFPGPELAIPQTTGGSALLLPAAGESPTAARYDLDMLEEFIKRMAEKADK
jgi:hypothetical protein